MTTDSYEEKLKDTNGNIQGKITISIGKPDKTGRRGVGVDYSAYYFKDESKQDFEDRLKYIEELAKNRLK